VKTVRDEFLSCQCSLFSPKGQPEQMLWEWIKDGERYSNGERLPAVLMRKHPANKQPWLPDANSHILRHIQSSNNLSMCRMGPLINQFAVFFLGRVLEDDEFVSSSSLLYRLERLRRIDQHYFNTMFRVWITTKDQYGFIRIWYMVTDDSKHHKTSRHVVIMTAHVGEATDVDAKPGFRLLSDAATKAKNSSGNSNANVETMEENLDMEIMSHFGGGTTDNASDAKKEVVVTFDDILDMVKASDDYNEMGTLYGFERLATRLGDPFHNGNLVVTGASKAAFDDRAK